MYEYLQAIILAIVQGVTEFIPVSSSAHLIVVEDFMSTVFGGVAFDVVLHLGTLLALLVYFRKDLSGLARSLKEESRNRRLLVNLIIASLPAAILGFFLFELAETLMRNLWLVVFMLVIVSVPMFLVDRRMGERSVHDLKTKDAWWIGLAQSLALIPGTSRSAATIVAGSWLGMSHVESARFSFLLAIPVLIGASVRVLLDQVSFQVIATHWDIYLVGLVVSFIAGLLVIKFLLSYLANHKLAVFAWYRIVLALILVVVLVI